MAIRKRRNRKALFEQFARIGKALASPGRLELLELLGEAPRTVDALAAETGMSAANTSAHLRVLRLTRLVDADKNGLFVTYRLADDEVLDFLRSLKSLAESRLAEIDRIVRDFVTDRGRLEPIDRRALLARARRGEVTVLDVRPAVEFREAHIAGALSIPLDELEARLGEIPADREVVAYCRGPLCLLAPEAVTLLTRRGFRASRLEDSVRDWSARGLPVERYVAAHRD